MDRLGDGLLLGVLDATPACVGILDPELRYLYVNPALARLSGKPAEEHLGRAVEEVLPFTGRGKGVLREVLADGRSREGINDGVTLSGAGLEHHSWRGAYHRLEADGDVVGVAVVIMVINGVRHQHRELERVRKRLALLDRAATRIGTTLRVDDTCAELSGFLSSELTDMAAVMMYPAPHGSEHLPERCPPPEHRSPPERHGPVLLRMAGVAAVPHLQDYLVEIRATVGEQLSYRHGSSVQRCLDSGRPVVENQLSAEELSRSIPDMEHFPAHRAVGVHSDLVVPLTARGHLMGVVVLVRVGDSPPFEHQDVVMAQDLVGRAAIGLDNARRYAREHGIAVELQRALLTEGLCPRPGIEVATRYLPAGDSALVGGDWYDVIPMSRRRTLLAMGDVMGHGVEAAVAMSHYRAMLRVVADDDLPPHAMLERLDELITRSGTDRPATCLLVLADPESGECLYTSAGHLPPAILDADGRVGLFPVPVGPPLGTGFGGYEMVTGCCAPDRTLLLYTDGLVERREQDVDEWLGRLTRQRLPSDGSLEDQLAVLLAGLVPGGTAEDDVAVMAARLNP
ncbi:GAF domain-containing protein [Streptomyces umbrinus]|uniref:SpoIIE family protein phosphatase n=1 Tax=Streptomyces umbrinus TaxID=67370 RepID=UPI00167DDE11|nr:SpoIIE family protein phosphatase [Streptomyces umbrinus]MCR3731537.1 GAF domain-containing protein [Streptomyces umbrinus]GHH39156.1 hypothetical protein GCM10018775_19150 [Streptomyces umbrinus]